MVDKKLQARMQIGKNGLTPGFIETLKNNFKTHANAKINVLKAGGHEKETVKKFSETILSELGKNYTVRIVGFTMFIKKWRKARE